MENKGSVTPLLLMPHKANCPGDVLGQHWTEGVGESKPCLKRAGVTSVARCGSPGAALQPQGPPRDPHLNLIPLAAFWYPNTASKISNTLILANGYYRTSPS